MVLLDAEDLAEGGIKSAYNSLLPALRSYVSSPDEILENLDENSGNYTVSSGGEVYQICGQNSADDEGQSWGAATFALFSIVNKQLENSEYKFYAINGGNDLGGLFLTSEQAISCRSTLPRQADWPYIPTNEHPWYGMFHED